jgi:hypothetical protein
MTSSYRLGDLIVQGYDNPRLNDEIVNEHPGSIGCDYVLSAKKQDRIGNATEIVLKHMEKHAALFPPDIENSTVVHLRLGDAVGGNHWFEKNLRPMDVSYYQGIIPQGKVYVIGKCHFGRWECSTNFEECTQLSNAYLMQTLSVLNATHFDGGNADVDLCCAVKAKLFVQGRGFYSKLIVEIRQRLGLQSVETNSHL